MNLLTSRVEYIYKFYKIRFFFLAAGVPFRNLYWVLAPFQISHNPLRIPEVNCNHGPNPLSGDQGRIAEEL
jgi:hypothetical protein